MRAIKVGSKAVGGGARSYIIAEGATNHNNRLDLGKRLIKEAHSTGADAIKFQTYTADKLVTKSAPRFWDMANKDHKAIGTQYDAYSKVDQLSEDSYIAMKKYADELGIEFFSTPFDNDSADFLETLGVNAYKIASCDVTNIPFLKYVARFDKPIFLSTGISNIGEVEEAIEAIYEEGNDKLILMHCTIKYPTPYENVNLRAMETMQKVFPEVPVGLSDHSIGIEVPLAAIALGATCIEKHYTFDKGAELSSDHWLAIDTKELGDLCRMSQHIHLAMGSDVKRMDPSEKLGKLYARRSLVANRDIAQGDIIDSKDISVKRPGTGIPPKFIGLIAGTKAARRIGADQTLQWEDVLWKE